MKPDESSPTAIILGAGCASRFDGVKQLAKLEGKPALQHVVDSVKAVEGGLNGLVVLGCAAGEIEGEIDFYDFSVVLNDDWQEGMSTSVKTGVKQAPESSAGYALLLADMPLITPEQIELVLSRASPESSIVAASYRGRRGFPVYFDCKWREELMTRPTGDVGARTVIKDHRDELSLVETDDDAVIFDIDEPGDLNELTGD